ncbi:MAG TPA: chemotaxis protein CheW [Dehalococcoidales bacterium]|nr:chemotaxis protein CheW [Dehalococcoidales bacterium]
MIEKVATAEKQLVVFTLAEESYAVDINMVKEIIQMQPITRVPGTPPSVEGVINLRGSVIPIVDLRKRFQLKTIERNKDTRIVVVACKGSEVGVIVDSVAEVLRISLEAIEPATSVFADEHLEHLLGIVKLTNRLVILLDMDHVLSRQEMAAIGSLDLKKKNQNNNSSNKEAVLS